MVASRPLCVGVSPPNNLPEYCWRVTSRGNCAMHPGVPFHPVVETASVMMLTLLLDPVRLAAWAQVETAVGVLMELCGWDANKARSRLVGAAVSVDAPVETVAKAVLALGPQHPPH